VSIVYLDTETTGLDPAIHEVWEMAWAVDDGPIRQSFLAHSGISADPKALEVGGYGARWPSRLTHHEPEVAELTAVLALTGNTFCAANPAFDAAFLRARWGKTPWKYRLFDIEAYAMGALGYEIPQGLKTIAADLQSLGHHDIPKPDHTAAGDVATLRACHLALKSIYGADQ
jgi:hypothetical protein